MTQSRVVRPVRAGIARRHFHRNVFMNRVVPFARPGNDRIICPLQLPMANGFGNMPLHHHQYRDQPMTRHGRTLFPCFYFCIKLQLSNPVKQCLESSGTTGNTNGREIITVHCDVGCLARTVELAC